MTEATTEWVDYNMYFDEKEVVTHWKEQGGSVTRMCEYIYGENDQDEIDRAKAFWPDQFERG